MSEIVLYKLENLVEGEVIKRPSQHIKSPYVADVVIKYKNAQDQEIEEDVLAHSISLGCCGMVDKGAKVMVKESNSNAGKCSHVVYLSVKENNVIVGIHSKVSEKIVEEALSRGILTKLQNIQSYKKEHAIYIKDLVDSRFDFTGIDKDGNQFIMEVKNVPLAENGVAYFPDGYRKSKKDPVSPRALKHINELILLKSMPNIRSIMCYVIQRDDVDSFKPSDVDVFYKDAFKRAVEAGVEIITLVVKWNSNGVATYVRDDLPILMD